MCWRNTRASLSRSNMHNGTLRFAHVNFLGKQRSSCSDARKGQICFPILMGKLILGVPWLSFLGGQRIPMSHIPSTHRAALICDSVESGSSLSNTDFEPGLVGIVRLLERLGKVHHYSLLVIFHIFVCKFYFNYLVKILYYTHHNKH